MDYSASEHHLKVFFGKKNRRAYVILTRGVGTRDAQKLSAVLPQKAALFRFVEDLRPPSRIVWGFRLTFRWRIGMCPSRLRPPSRR